MVDPHMARTLGLLFLAVLGTGCSESAGAEQVAPSAEAEPPVADPPTARAGSAIALARNYLGTPYVWAGRDTEKHPGLDCLGLLYRAWGPVTGTPWTRYPVNPTKLVASGMLGAPVPGLDGVLREELDPGLLRPGDVLYLLIAEYEIPDAPLWVHDGVRYWPWHTGLYVGEGRGTVIHAGPSSGVAEQPLMTLAFDALYVTRP